MFPSHLVLAMQGLRCPVAHSPRGMSHLAGSKESNIGMQYIGGL